MQRNALGQSLDRLYRAFEVRPAVRDLGQNILYRPIGTVITAPASPIAISPLSIANLTDTSVTVSFLTDPTDSSGSLSIAGVGKDRL